jgi:hypothetical protein
VWLQNIDSRDLMGKMSAFNILLLLGDIRRDRGEKWRRWAASVCQVRRTASGSRCAFFWQFADVSSQAGVKAVD